MENEKRIELDVANSNKFVKINGKKVEIQPYISTMQFAAISEVCLKYLKQYNNDLAKVAFVKTLFDMAVVHCCTNIYIEGFETKETEKTFEIKFSGTKDTFASFDERRIIKNVAAIIDNYNECYKLLLEILNMCVSYGVVEEFTNKLPSPDTFVDALKTSLQQVAELKEKDPATFEKIVKEVASNEIVESTKKNVVKKNK